LNGLESFFYCVGFVGSSFLLALHADILFAFCPVNFSQRSMMTSQ
jgi:hypothetical protein